MMDSLLGLSTDDWQSIGTIVTALATVALVVATWRYVRLTHRLQETTERAVIEQSRPYVYLNLYSEDMSLHVEVANSGHRPARNIKIVTKPDLKELAHQDARGRIMDPSPLLSIAFLAPQSKVENHLHPSKAWFQKLDQFKDTIVAVHVCYNGMNSVESYEERYEIRIDDFYYETHIVRWTLERQVGQVASSVKELIKAVDKVGSTLDRLRQQRGQQ